MADIYKVTMRAIIAIASHLCGIAVIPTLILADRARAITRAITEVWPNAERLMCFLHMIKAALDVAKPILPTKECTASFKKDLWRLHLETSQESFDMIKEECLNSWPSHISSYMREQWPDGAYSHWQVFRGRVGCTRSNQGTESCNSLIKRFFTFRKVSKISECMTAMCKVIDSFGLRRRQFELARKFKRPLIKEMAVLSRPFQLIETDDGANIIEGEIAFMVVGWTRLASVACL